MIQGAAFVFNDYYCLLSESIIEEQEDAQDKHQTKKEVKPDFPPSATPEALST